MGGGDTHIFFPRIQLQVPTYRGIKWIASFLDSCQCINHLNGTTFQHAAHDITIRTVYLGKRLILIQSSFQIDAIQSLNSNSLLQF